MEKRFSRQCFLGGESSMLLGSVNVGVIGLGGGGSHIVQQLAHIGVGKFTLIDPQRIELSNLNRLVGATLDDVENKSLKVDIAERLISRISPDIIIKKHAKKWQEAAEALRGCTVLFGCVDSFSDREQLEIFSRRYIIPYIDIGMDVHMVDSEYLISGQAILSMPDNLCMRCFGFITDKVLKEEAHRYGVAGDKPQVIWPNGVLASTAIGLFMQLITPWHKKACSAYLEYNGNTFELSSSFRYKAIQGHSCHHFDPIDNIGDLFWKRG
ncbi:MAG: ThiF family adenylyltransferase [Candidatus Omnitrophota bacterium]|jgi:hypothetical protein